MEEIPTGSSTRLVVRWERASEEVVLKAGDFCSELKKVDLTPAALAALLERRGEIFRPVEESPVLRAIRRRLGERYIPEEHFVRMAFLICMFRLVHLAMEVIRTPGIPRWSIEQESVFQSAVEGLGICYTSIRSLWEIVRLPLKGSEKVLQLWLEHEKQGFVEQWKQNLLLAVLGWVTSYLKENVVIVPVWRAPRKHFEEIKLSLKIKPKDAYAWILYREVLGQRVFRCQVCGQPTAFKKYCSDRCARKVMATAGKQEVLAYLRTQKNRERLTEEEFNFAREVADKYRYEEGKIIIGRIIAAFKKRWPERDYTFLQGFGSKRNKPL